MASCSKPAAKLHLTVTVVATKCSDLITVIHSPVCTAPSRLLADCSFNTDLVRQPKQRKFAAGPAVADPCLAGLPLHCTQTSI